MNDHDIEQEIQAKGLTAPRVTPQDLEANITDIEIVKHVEIRPSSALGSAHHAVRVCRGGKALVFGFQRERRR